jgi:hypothetical protein
MFIASSILAARINFGEAILSLQEGTKNWSYKQDVCMVTIMTRVFLLLSACYLAL